MSNKLNAFSSFLTLTFILLTQSIFIKGQQYTANHSFLAGETAVYPQGSFVTNFAGVTLRYTAGVSLTLQTSTTVLFPQQTIVYGTNGPETYAGNTPVTFPYGKIMALAPGTVMQHTTSPTVIRYSQFFGSNVAFVTYDNAATIFFNSPTRPSVFPAGTNSINYYNPAAVGGTPLYGPSAPRVNFARQYTATVDTIVTGYTAQGWPTRSYTNIGTGEVYMITQTGTDAATVMRTVTAGTNRFLP